MKPHPDFEALDIPTDAFLGDYHLNILTAADVEEDLEAVTSSTDVLRGLFGPEWPAGLTREANLTDLHWHHREFSAKRSFAWVIRDAEGRYLGCAYLFPTMGARGTGEGVYWMIKSPDRMAHLEAFGPLYEDWVSALLPASFVVSYTNNAYL